MLNSELLRLQQKDKLVCLSIALFPIILMVKNDVGVREHYDRAANSGRSISE